MLFDGHSLAYRAFYALPPDLRTSTGQTTNAVFGFTSMLIKAMADHKTRHIAVAFDRGLSAERVASRPEYKAQRVAAPDEFRQQMGLIHEVLNVLRAPVFEIEGVEADDIIHILAKKIAEAGRDVMVVTADRDFFQMVGPHIHLMMNKRGISDTVIYDEKGVLERYGFGPDLYLDYAALRGDPSDNIEGVAGIGEKTAGKLITTYGSLEKIFKHLDDLTPKIREKLGEAEQRLLENREFFRLRTEPELASQGISIESLGVDVDSLTLGEWDFPEIRKLFDALEFRILYERLLELDPSSAPAARESLVAETFEVVDLKALVALANKLTGQSSLIARITSASPRSAPEIVSILAEGASHTVRIGARLASDKVWKILGPLFQGASLVTHASKEALQSLAAAGIYPPSVAMDTEIAAYLVDPARGSYTLEELSVDYLDREILPTSDSGAGQQSLSLEEVPHEDTTGLHAAAIGALAPILEKQLRERGGWDLFVTLELPLAQVLARVEATGIKIDGDYLRLLSQRVSTELRSLEEEIFHHAGGPFNINSPPQLRQVLYERLSLKPSKKTKTGYSTDASVLESLREEHAIIDAILKYREKSKLKSTYLDALPPMADPVTGRIHCRFNQTIASTGRISSDTPNLQNIPIRTAEGKQIRKAFVADEGNVLLVADYSQIELRILAHLSGDSELSAAFNRGDDIHRLSIGKAMGIDPSDVTPELRSVGKMVSYGVTYGMGPFGLAQRLKIPLPQAKTYIDGFFALYPGVREFLDSVVAKATEDGFTTTMLGRRRYVPELKSRNPRVRSLGERQALNAPIQGTAADIIKVAMVKTDAAVEATNANMVLTVHDELVFEVPEPEVADVAELVREAMESAVELDVPLSVDLAWGPNWAEAKS